MGLFSRGPRNRTPSSDLQVDVHVGDDPALVERALAGDASGLADQLSTLRSTGDTLRRSQLIVRAAAASVDRRDWLDAWLAAAPDDVDAAQVDADQQVHQAWAARSGTVASAVSDRQFRAFHQLLADAGSALQRALGLSRGSDHAWGTVLDQCRGLEAPIEDVGRYVEEASETAPDGFVWRSSVAEYLSPWWFGDSDRAWAFAVESVGEVGPTSLVSLLPANVAIRSFWKTRSRADRARVDEALPAALRYVAGLEPGSFAQVHLANRVACWLVLAGLYQEALPALQAADGRVDSVAWDAFDSPATAVFEDAVRLGRQGRTQAPLA